MQRSRRGKCARTPIREIDIIWLNAALSRPAPAKLNGCERNGVVNVHSHSVGCMLIFAIACTEISAPQLTLVKLQNMRTLFMLFFLCLPLVRIKYFSELNFRLVYFSSLLIWLIVFNHRAESSTFVIAVTGIAIWFFTSEKKTVNIILVVMAFVLTSLSPTDLFPPYLMS